MLERQVVPPKSPAETVRISIVVFFFFNDPATTEIYTLSLHDALPISRHLLHWIVTASLVCWKEPMSGPASRDRKSTRLNSSHQIISYAVFCLKKKSVFLARRGSKPFGVESKAARQESGPKKGPRISDGVDFGQAGQVEGNFFFNDTATTEIYTLSLHDALPISSRRRHTRSDRDWSSDLVCRLLLRSEEHTSELQSRSDLVCRLLLEKNRRTPCPRGVPSAPPALLGVPGAHARAVLRAVSWHRPGGRPGCAWKLRFFFFLRTGRPPRSPLSPSPTLSR